jgi:hypothetical protein
MAEHDTAAAPTPAPEAEVRALADIALVEAARGDQAALVELAKAFDEAIAADLELHPGFIYTGPGSLQRAAIARMARITLAVARAAGPKGVRLDLLKRVYQALDVPPRLAEFIERKLTTDGVGGVSCGRLYFAGDRATWARLAQTRAE